MIEFEEGASEIEKYKISGSQTEITPEIQKIVDEIQGTTLEKVEKILNMGPTLVTLRDFDREVFRKRDADKILQDGYVTGCIDSAIIFLAFARGCGIPAVYVEVITKEWLERGGKSYSGHAYARIYDETKGWILIDPILSKVDVQIPEKRVLFREGRDSWDIGIKDFDDQEREFNSFRNQWLEEQKSK